MPAEHFVPRFAASLSVSPRVQANALKALAMDAPTTDPAQWAPKAAAALMLGAQWAGEEWTQADVAEATHVAEKDVARHYAEMARRLRL